MARVVYGSGYHHVVSSAPKYLAYATALRARIAEDESAFATIAKQLERSFGTTDLSQATLSELRAAELLHFCEP